MEKHVPGPWKYHLGRGANPRFHIQTEGGYQIASTTELVRHSQAYEENASRESNARLIAAAPELLEALEAIQARINGEWDHPALVKFGALGTEASDIREILARAIAKAEGKSND